jgi:hypothetical protein
MPKAEFIVATPDSSVWVTVGRDGVRIRGVPMTLASVGGRFWEVYVADVDRSFSDAILTGERLYVRDLVAGDSTLVLDDSVVNRLADRHAREDPEAVPLNPNDDDPEDPTVVATGETDVLDVRGPYVVIEHRTAVQHSAGERFDTVRMAIDLRARRATSLTRAARDTAAKDSTRPSVFPYTWHRTGYDLVAEQDTAQQTVTLTLRDSRRHTWPILTVSAAPRIYWLDAPPVSVQIRRALTRAFNMAAAYDASVKFVHQFLVPFSRPSVANRI